MLMPLCWAAAVALSKERGKSHVRRGRVVAIDNIDDRRRCRNKKIGLVDESSWERHDTSCMLYSFQIFLVMR